MKGKHSLAAWLAQCPPLLRWPAPWWSLEQPRGEQQHGFLNLLCIVMSPSAVQLPQTAVPCGASWLCFCVPQICSIRSGCHCFLLDGPRLCQGCGSPQLADDDSLMANQDKPLSGGQPPLAFEMAGRTILQLQDPLPFHCCVSFLLR